MAKKHAPESGARFLAFGLFSPFRIFIFFPPKFGKQFLNARTAKTNKMLATARSKGKNNIQVRWIQKGFIAEASRHDSGVLFRQMIRVEAQKSELQAKIRSYRLKSELQTKSQSYNRADPQNLNRIAQKRNRNRV